MKTAVTIIGGAAIGITCVALFGPWGYAVMIIPCLAWGITVGLVAGRA